MAGTEPKLDRELLGRVAALTPRQQRWLRVLLQSVLAMEPVGRRSVEEEPEERPRRRKTPAPASEPTETPQRKGLDELLSGEGASEDDFPELAKELEGIADIADLLREGGRRRRRIGEELMRLFEAPEGSNGEDEQEEDEGGRLN